MSVHRKKTLLTPSKPPNKIAVTARRCPTATGKSLEEADAPASPAAAAGAQAQDRSLLALDAAAERAGAATHDDGAAV